MVEAITTKITIFEKQKEWKRQTGNENVRIRFKEYMIKCERYIRCVQIKTDQSALTDVEQYNPVDMGWGICTQNGLE